MTSPATSLQIGGIFILFMASFLGVTIPITTVKENMKEILALLNAASAGIMLGLALVMKHSSNLQNSFHAYRHI